ncbi:sugar-transfer associated ATP-grasp domain-containing protein [Marinibacterium sp. SX1]|uniref:sugar-transfer associated ATP-grasp domain-containing protein n=1 Tax=Marinibacterium sp. SX1 TaxID=3388424 RepID=UPI003D17F54D
MTATATNTETKALLEPPKFQGAPKAEKIVTVARQYGVSPLRQWREMTALWLGKTRIPTHEYYNFGLYDPAIPMEEKKQYVGIKGSWLINKELTPKTLPWARGFVGNKVMFTSLIDRLGFRTTETQAVVSTRSRFGAIPTLDTPEALEHFLRHDARYPLFGKPSNYSGSFGSALIDRLEGDEIVLGDDRRLGLDAFCREIIAEYGEGYLLQSAIEQNRAMTEMVGRAIGTIRLVTIRDGAMPRPFYALWKIPSPKAMSDNFWQDGSMIAPVEMETGQVGQAWIGTGLDARSIDSHPVSGRAFAGFALPFWDEARRMATEAHALFPEFGVIGWDVAFTEEGPLLIECNDNPFHTLYQMAFRRGIWNDDTRPVLERTIARSKVMMDEKKAVRKRREDKRKRN